jgi:hypothetical protein
MWLQLCVGDGDRALGPIRKELGLPATAACCMDVSREGDVRL